MLYFKIIDSVYVPPNDLQKIYPEELFFKHPGTNLSLQGSSIVFSTIYAASGASGAGMT